MPDLNTQLREYFDATAPPLEVEEVVGDEVRVPGGKKTPSRRWTAPGWAYGLATMVVVLVLILGLALLLPGGNEDDVVEPTPTTVAPNPETMSDLETIEAAIAAFYSGDAQRAAELFELPDRTDDEIRGEAAYQAAIGGQLTLNYCTGGEGGVFSCDMAYHNAMIDAIDSRDAGYPDRVVIEDGVITEFAFREDSMMVHQMGTFLAMEGLLAGYENCLFGPFPESCATIQLENLDSWVEWRQTVEPRDLVEFGLESWYGGDCEGARFVSELEADACSTQDTPTQTIEYESILGADVTVEGCEKPVAINGGWKLLCDVHYSNALSSAVGKPPSVITREFSVDLEHTFIGAPITFDLWYLADYPEDTELRESFTLFAEGGELADEYAAADCASARTPECATLILDNLDEWAAWYETNS